MECWANASEQLGEKTMKYGDNLEQRLITTSRSSLPVRVSRSALQPDPPPARIEFETGLLLFIRTVKNLETQNRRGSDEGGRPE